MCKMVSAPACNGVDTYAFLAGNIKEFKCEVLPESLGHPIRYIKSFNDKKNYFAANSNFKKLDEIDLRCSNF